MLLLFEVLVLHELVYIFSFVSVKYKKINVYIRLKPDRKSEEHKF